MNVLTMLRKTLTATAVAAVAVTMLGSGATIGSAAGHQHQTGVSQATKEWKAKPANTNVVLATKEWKGATPATKEW